MFNNNTMYLVPILLIKPYKNLEQLSFCLVPNKFLRNVNGSTCEEREKRKEE